MTYPTFDRYEYLYQCQNDKIIAGRYGIYISTVRIKNLFIQNEILEEYPQDYQDREITRIKYTTTNNYDIVHTSYKIIIDM